VGQALTIDVWRGGEQKKIQGNKKGNAKVAVDQCSNRGQGGEKISTNEGKIRIKQKRS